MSQDDHKQLQFLQKYNNILLDNNLIIHPDAFEQFKLLFLRNDESRSACLIELLKYQLGEDIIIRKLLHKNIQSNLEPYCVNLIDVFVLDLGDYVLKVIEETQQRNILLQRIIKIFKIAENRLDKQIRQQEQSNFTKVYEELCKKKISLLAQRRSILEQNIQSDIEEESKSEIQ